ncbi:hypothetical protein ASAP_1669 [Asaia bogorensis]|uniref:Uncharacterized protein n=1 Tax=Asaia bogorensis TaxID=91915 RepID=A0A060QF47_9PROT|nr:hypothetical protein P792_04660 [Asaia sp. SF2.1]CDG39714.1 hypothetical protein ASAP_1669 [Asaia bogorensis]
MANIKRKTKRYPPDLTDGEWVAMKAATIAAERRMPGPIAMQAAYSLVARDVEAEHFPVAREGGR